MLLALILQAPDERGQNAVVQSTAYEKHSSRYSAQEGKHKGINEGKHNGIAQYGIAAKDFSQHRQWSDQAEKKEREAQEAAARKKDETEAAAARKAEKEKRAQQVRDEQIETKKIETIEAAAQATSIAGVTQATQNTQLGRCYKG